MDNASMRTAAFAFGAIYFVVGLVGFAFTGFTPWADNGTDAIIIFEVNPFHNVIHLGVGALAMAAAAVGRQHPGVTQGAVVGIGIVYFLAAMIGFTGNFEPLSIDGPASADNFLHLGSALVLLYIGRFWDIVAQRPADA